MTTYRDRLIWAMQKKEISQTQLAKLANVKPQAIQHICDPKKNAKGSTHTATFAKILGIDALWLESGYGDALSIKKDMMPQEDYTNITLFDVSASAGSGSFVFSEESIGTIKLSNEVAREIIGRNFDKIKAIYVKGDSMEPTIFNGDIAFVDTSQRSIESDGIYVFTYAEKLHIKRIQIADCFVIKSDNKKYEDLIAKESELNVIGKVVKTWKL